jgi:hypothetical protein
MVCLIYIWGMSSDKIVVGSIKFFLRMIIFKLVSFDIMNKYNGDEVWIEAIFLFLSKHSYTEKVSLAVWLTIFFFFFFSL